MRTERVAIHHTEDAIGPRAYLTLREPCGRDELGVEGLDTRTAVDFLDRLIEISPIAKEQPSALRMSASDRDALFAALHRLCWGDRIVSTLTCGECAERFDLSFELSALQRQLHAERRPLNPNTVELSRHTGMDRRYPDCMDASKPGHPWSLGSGDPCRNDEATLNSTALPLDPPWRIPTGADEIASVATGSAREAVRSLAERCGLQEEDGDIQALADALEAAAPILDVDLIAQCPECGHSQFAHFDLQSFLLQRVMGEREILFEEVHVLAENYGWSLREILGLSRSSRRGLLRRIVGKGAA